MLHEDPLILQCLDQRLVEQMTLEMALLLSLPPACFVD
jgi:hypothetical protein